MSPILLLTLVWTLSGPAPSLTDSLSHARDEIVADLKNNILPYWERYTVDPAGGFYGSVSRAGEPVSGAAKGQILNSRILWTFSAAWRHFGEENYLTLANRARDYFQNHFIDPVYGGVYGSVSATGQPLDTLKHMDGLAYAIYGYSEHYRATGDIASLQTAIRLYHDLQRAHDPVHGGWFDTLNRDWSPRTPSAGISGRPSPVKSMNTHIHILEALADLYKVWRDRELAASLREVLVLLDRTIYNPRTCHLRLYFDTAWTLIGDTDSYGHEIETSWMLHDAAAALGDPALLAETDKISVDLCRAALRDGLNEIGGLTIEKNKVSGRARRGMTWWGQAEAVNGCLTAWKISGDDRLLRQALRSWDFIKERFIDYEYGEWFRTLLEDGSPIRDEPKCGMWNCPYHNTRMGFLLLEP